MKRFWRRSGRFCTDAALVAALLLSAGEVHAQDTQLPDVSRACLSSDDGLQLTRDGQSGIWFEMDVARCVLSRLQALPLYSERVRLLEQRLQLSDERHRLMEREVQLSEEAQQHAEEALLSAERGRRQAEEDAEFERSLRWVWFGVGVVVVVALEALAIWGLSELDL